jgi:D-alanyl-D-alanine dipeptidase
MLRLLLCTLFLISCLAVAVEAEEKKPAEVVLEGSRMDEPMVDLAKFAPGIVIEQRYKTERNLAKRPIYPKNARCYVRKSVADRLLRAQQWLDANTPRGTRLKIWDAWRPNWAQSILWKVLPNAEYLGDPTKGGSLHTWGVCVDATLVDKNGQDLRMPTDFDVIIPEARTFYQGEDREVRRNVRNLQSAMSKGGFLVVHDEWWHFVARDWNAYGPMDVSITGDEAPQ